MRRAKAAAERLCILGGDAFPWERRDVAVLLWHTGEVSQAVTELEAYVSSTYYRTTAKAGEKSLVERLLTLMQSHPGKQMHYNESLSHYKLQSSLLLVVLLLRFMLWRSLQSFAGRAAIIKESSLL